MPKIKRQPVYIELDRPRELIFNLNSAILLRDHGAEDARMVELIGEDENGNQKFQVNHSTLRLYLWAALQTDARRKGETLSLEDAGDLVEPGREVEAVAKVNAAIDRFYGGPETGK